MKFLKKEESHDDFTTLSWNGGLFKGYLIQGRNAHKGNCVETKKKEVYIWNNEKDYC